VFHAWLAALLAGVFVELLAEFARAEKFTRVAAAVNTAPIARARK